MRSGKIPQRSAPPPDHRMHGLSATERVRDRVCMPYNVARTCKRELFVRQTAFRPPLARNAPPELLAAEKRNAANDPADYFEYVMLSWGNCQAGDKLVTERRLGRFPDGDDLSIGFAPAVRFYFRYDDLAKHPNCCFDGVLPMKIKDAIILSEWVYAIVIPEGLRHELQDAVPRTATKDPLRCKRL